MERTYVYLWLICVVVWQKPTQHCKVIILQLKMKRILKKIFGERKPLGREVMYFNTSFNKLPMMNFSFHNYSLLILNSLLTLTSSYQGSLLLTAASVPGLIYIVSFYPHIQCIILSS